MTVQMGLSGTHEPLQEIEQVAFRSPWHRVAHAHGKVLSIYPGGSPSQNSGSRQE